MNKTFKLEGLDCAACAAELEEIILKVKGVSSASVDFMAQKVRFECESDEVAEEVAKRCNSFEDVKVVDGAPACNTDEHGRTHSHGHEECGRGRDYGAHSHSHEGCGCGHEHGHEHCCAETCDGGEGESGNA